MKTIRQTPRLRAEQDLWALFEKNEVLMAAGPAQAMLAGARNTQQMELRLSTARRKELAAIASPVCEIRRP